MIFPIGYGTEVRVRLPIVTLLIVLINIGVGIYIIPQYIEEEVARGTLQNELSYKYMQEKFAEEEPDNEPPDYREIEKLLQQRSMRAREALRAVTPRVNREVYEEFGVPMPVQWGFTPAQVQWQDVIAHMFIHFSILHLAINMMFLFITGVLIEHLWGRLAYLFFYILFGLTGAGVYYFLNPQSMEPLVGASGAIAGLMGAFLVTHPKLPIKFMFWLFFPKVIAIPAFLVLPAWYILEIVLQRVSDITVVHEVHLVGFLVGAVCAYLLGQTRLAKNVQESYNYDLSDPHEETIAESERLISNGKPARAQKELLKILEENPDHVRARMLYAQAYEVEENIEQATNHWARVIPAGIERLDKQNVAEAYQKLHLHGSDVPLSAAHKFYIIKALIAVNNFQLARELYEELWQNGDNDFTLRQQYDYARFLVENCEDYATAWPILEAMQQHPEMVGAFRDEVDQLRRQIEQNAPELMNNTAPDAEKPSAEDAAEDASLAFNMQDSGDISVGGGSYQPGSTYEDDADAPPPGLDTAIPTPTAAESAKTDTVDDYGTIDLSETTPVAPNSGAATDPFDFQTLDLSTSATDEEADVEDPQIPIEPPPPIYHAAAIQLSKIGKNGIQFKVEDERNVLQWSDAITVCLAKVAGAYRLDFIYQTEPSEVQAWSLNETDVTVPPSLQISPAKLMAELAKKAKANGCRWLFTKSGKPVIKNFNSVAEFEDAVFDALPSN